MEKFAQPGEGGGGNHAQPLSQYLPSRTKLWCCAPAERADTHPVSTLPLYAFCGGGLLFLLFCILWTQDPGGGNGGGGILLTSARDTWLPAVVFRFARFGLLSVDIIIHSGQQVLALRLFHHDETLRLIYCTFNLFET
jgi:hypothetical protein